MTPIKRQEDKELAYRESDGISVSLRCNRETGDVSVLVEDSKLGESFVVPAAVASSTTAFTAPLDGVAAGRLVFRRGATRVRIRAAEIDALCQIAFSDPRAVRASATRGDVIIESRLTFAAIWGRVEDWVDVTLNASLPWSIEVDGSLGNANLDLRDLDLRHLEITGRTYDSEILLPKPRGGVVAIRTRRAALDIALLRPQGVPAQLRVAADVRRLVFDDAEFGSLGNACLQTPEAGLAIDRYEIHVGARSEGVTIGECLGRSIPFRGERKRAEQADHAEDDEECSLTRHHDEAVRPAPRGRAGVVGLGSSSDDVGGSGPDPPPDRSWKGTRHCSL